MIENPLLVILGPTASGKTKLAVKLADVLSGEIISADSRQVFRGMDIGTGKDILEYKLPEKNIPYHLIDIRAAGESYNVNEFKEDFYRAFEEVTLRNALPILCGGTGMYVHSIFQNQQYTAVPVNQELRAELIPLDIQILRDRLIIYPKELVAHADLSSHKRLIRMIEIAEYLMHHELKVQNRPDVNPFVAALTNEVEQRRNKVIKRLQTRFKSGMVEEVKTLLATGVSREMLTFYGLEYKFITAYLYNEISYEVLSERLAIAICQFAKRQMTFFRKMEKDGIKINWFNADEEHDVLITEVLDSFNLWRIGTH